MLGRPSERWLRILSSIATGLLLAACPASAQGGDLAELLAANANCSSVGDARASLETTLNRASPDTPRDAIVTALQRVASRDDLCTELREAARNFADQAADLSPARDGNAMSPTSSSIVAATLAEAERRAANLRFEVAPPPRFVTRERNSRP